MKLFRILVVALFYTCSVSTVSADGEGTEREGGILGTGIVGTITALGSIYVNGQHILYDQGMDVAGSVSLTQASELLPGHTVAVIAHPEDDHWRASHIRQVAPLVGPLQRTSDGQYTVMGTQVLIAGETNEAFSTGDWVAVSGLWQTDTVIATRLDRVSAEQGARVEGSVLAIVEGKPVRVGATEIVGLIPQHLTEGGVVRAEGIPLDTALQVTRLETGVFDNSPGVIFVEGYLSPPEVTGLYTVLGSNIISYTDNPDMIDPTIRYIACGEAGELTAMIDVTQDISEPSDCPFPFGGKSDD